MLTQKQIRRRTKAIFAFMVSLSAEARHQWAFSVMCYRLAKQMRLIRRDRGLTQTELAAKSGLNFTTINCMEKHTGFGMRNVSFKSLIAVAAAFDCAVMGEFRSFSSMAHEYAQPVSVPPTLLQEMPPSGGMSAVK